MIEYLLAREADFTLTDLRGSREEELRYRERWSPSTRQVSAAAGLIGLVGGALIEAGLTLTGLVIALLGVAVFTHQDELAAYLERGPAVDVIERSTPGLSEKEVHEYFTLHQEYKQIQKEKREEKEREYKNKGPSGRSLNTK